MTEEAWTEGMAMLAVAFPTREEDPRAAALRGRVYREALDDLTDGAWLTAVREAIRDERWFPSVAALREYAEAAAPPPLALPAPQRTPEQEAEARSIARLGLELVKAAFRKALAAGTVKAPAAAPPAKRWASRLSDDEWATRVEELREQARTLEAKR